MSMTKQEVFDKVARHLLTQRAKAVSTLYTFSPKCAYRSPDGLSCAIGCLIPDSLYTSTLEGTPVGGGSGILLLTVLRQANVSVDNYADVSFLSDLQGVHDLCPVEAWKDQLLQVAVRYELSANAVLNIEE